MPLTAVVLRRPDSGAALRSHPPQRRPFLRAGHESSQVRSTGFVAALLTVSWSLSGTASGLWSLEPLMGMSARVLFCIAEEIVLCVCSIGLGYAKRLAAKGLNVVLIRSVCETLQQLGLILVHHVASRDNAKLAECAKELTKYKVCARCPVSTLCLRSSLLPFSLCVVHRPRSARSRPISARPTSMTGPLTGLCLFLCLLTPLRAHMHMQHCRRAQGPGGRRPRQQRRPVRQSTCLVPC